jgi:uncharacterized repeat protein (TIGR03803 family)
MSKEDKGVIMKIALSAAALACMLVAFILPTYGSTITSLIDFPAPQGIDIGGPPLQLSDGTIVAAATEGGVYNKGVVFAIRTDGELLWSDSFDGHDGNRPVGGVTLGDDGFLYGTAATGGAYGAGVVYRVTQSGKLSVLRNFDIKNGSSPDSRLVEGPTGVFYGTAQEGVGPTGYYGEVYEFSAKNPISILHSFTGADGESPEGVVFGPSGDLYGAASRGGTDSSGNPTSDGDVYEMSPSTGDLTILHDFLGPEGAFPGPTVFDDAGNLYGMTSAYETGSTQSSAQLFEISNQGAFADLSYIPVGSYPSGNIVVGSDGDLYGAFDTQGIRTTSVFRYSRAGGLQTAFSLPGDVAGDVLLNLGYDGTLYGAGLGGGIAGSIFHVLPDDSVYVIFTQPMLDGAQSAPGLVAAANGLLYGATYYGGQFGYGCVFSISTDGTFTTIHAFDGKHGGHANSPLILDRHGNLYGSCTSGCQFGEGGIFRISRSGVYSVIISCNSESFGDASPSVVKGGTIYGISSTIGNGYGDIFALQADGSLSIVYSFSANNGFPNTPVIFGPDGKLYGATQFGGANGLGSIYSLTLAGQFAPIHDLQLPQGAYAQGLAFGSDGNIYGSCWIGGKGSGVIFQLQPGGTFTALHTNEPSGPSSPTGALLEVKPGVFAGSDEVGDTVFEITSTGQYTNLGRTGDAGLQTPNGGVVLGADGALYGPCVYGGQGLGGIFRCAP